MVSQTRGTVHVLNRKQEEDRQTREVQGDERDFLCPGAAHIPRLGMGP